MGRAYANPFNPDEKHRYPSVTSILGLELKDLNGWRAMEVAKWCVENWGELGVDPERAYKRALAAPERTRDERAWVGSGVHAYIQAEHEGTWDYPELDEEQQQIIANWRLFNEAYLVEPILTEATVVSDEHDYMGTLDGVWSITDRLSGETWTTLLDLKSSRRIYGGAMMQVAALSRADYVLTRVPEPTETSASYCKKSTKAVSHWEKRDLPVIDRVAILHLRADRVELIDAENLDLRFEQFLAYRELHRLRGALKGRDDQYI